MARSTPGTPTNEETKGMHKVSVVNAGIKDSLGRYCNKGDIAYLKPALAAAYHSQNLVAIELPDLDSAVAEAEAAAAVLEAAEKKAAAAEEETAALKKQVAALEKMSAAKDGSADDDEKKGASNATEQPKAATNTRSGRS